MKFWSRSSLSFPSSSSWRYLLTGCCPPTCCKKCLRHLVNRTHTALSVDCVFTGYVAHWTCGNFADQHQRLTRYHPLIASKDKIWVYIKKYGKLIPRQTFKICFTAHQVFIFFICFESFICTNTNRLCIKFNLIRMIPSWRFNFPKHECINLWTIKKRNQYYRCNKSEIVRKMGN